MQRNYKLNQRLLASVLLVSLFLQSCLNSPIFPISTNDSQQASHEQDSIREQRLETNSLEHEVTLYGASHPSASKNLIVTKDKLQIDQLAKTTTGSNIQQSSTLSSTKRRSDNPTVKKSVQDKRTKTTISADINQRSPVKTQLSKESIWKFKTRQGQQVKIYQQREKYQAKVTEKIGKFTRKPQLLPVYFEPGIDLEQLTILPQSIQEQYIHVILPKSNTQQAKYVYVGKKGLLGGGNNSGKEKTSKEEGEQEKKKEVEGKLEDFFRLGKNAYDFFNEGYDEYLEIAIEYLTKAAEQGHEEARVILQKMIPGDQPLRLEKKLEEKEPEGRTSPGTYDQTYETVILEQPNEGNLSKRYYKEDGDGQKDREKEKETEKEEIVKESIKELREYAQNGNVEAQFRLGKRAYKTWQDRPTERTADEAKKWLTKAAAQGHQRAGDLLAKFDKNYSLQRNSNTAGVGKKKEKEKCSDEELLVSSLGIEEFVEWPTQSQQQTPYTYNEALIALQSNSPQAKVIDLRQEQLTKEQLEDLKQAIDDNFVVGYIEWGEIPANCQELKEQIEKKLVDNICNYTYHPNDYIHGLLSSHSYDEPKVDDQIDLTDVARKLGHELPTSIWKVEQVQDDSKDSGFYSALYINDKTHQAVLAFQGTYPDIKKPDRVIKDLIIEDMQGVLGNAVTRQQKLTYVATKDAVEYVKKEGFNLSITGHSLGAYLAELGVAFCYRNFDYREVKGIVFDSPGTDRKLNTFQSNVINPSTKLEIENLPIIAYLSAPNFVNSCNGHPGEVYRVHPKLEGSDWLSKYVGMAQNLPLVSPLIQMGNKSSIALLGHSLVIILGEFDATTGKPKEYVRVKDWPKLSTDNIEHVGKQSKLNILLKPYLGDVSAATSSMVSVLRDLPNLISGEKQYWTTLTYLDESYKEKPLGSEDEFERSYVGHYQISPISIDVHPLQMDGYESIDGFLHALWEEREEICELQTNDITGIVLRNILQDYTIEVIAGKPCLLLKQNPRQIHILRDKMQRAKDVLTSTRIKETLKHSRKQAFANYMIQCYSKQLEEAHTKVLPKLHSYIALAKLRHYVAREYEQQKLARKLKKKGICVVYGYGGVGKSTLVAHYGHEQKSKKTVWWISAETWDKLIRSCENIAQELGINYQALVQEFKEDSSKYLPELARKVYHALEDRGQPTLIILDNAPNSTLITECLSNKPDLVQVIITTRDKRGFADYSKIQLGPFTVEEGKKYVQQRLQSLKPSEKDVEILINEIGLVPQKLDLATGYIREIPLMDIQKYLQKLEELKEKGRREAGKLRLPEANLGLESLEPQAQLLMRYGVYLDPDFISLPLITKVLGISDGEELDAILSPLEKLSLITIVNLPRQVGIQIHREIQTTCKAYQDWKGENKASEHDLIENLVQVLATLMPNVDRVPDITWDQARLYAPHIASVIAYATGEEMINLELAKLLVRIGNYNEHVVHNYKQALSNYQQAFKMRKDLYEGNHSDIANSLNSIGKVYYGLGQRQDALNYYEKALKMLEDLYDGNHLSIASSFNNIGAVYYALGQNKDALNYYEKALKMLEDLYDGNHSSIASSLNNIGVVYNHLGQNKEALNYYEKTLKMWEAVYEGNHPDIATSLNNIGIVYNSLGDHQEALNYHEKALKMREDLYEGNHPNIATSLNNIGIVYSDLGQKQEALKYYEKAFKMREDLYEGNHPDIASSFNNIGAVYSDLGQNKDALNYYEKALKMREDLYEGNHPSIATSLNNIGNVYYALGQKQEALNYHEKALKMWEDLYKGNDSKIKLLKNKIASLKKEQEEEQNHMQKAGCIIS